MSASQTLDSSGSKVLAATYPAKCSGAIKRGAAGIGNPKTSVSTDCSAALAILRRVSMSAAENGCSLGAGLAACSASLPRKSKHGHTWPPPRASIPCHGATPPPRKVSRAKMFWQTNAFGAHSIKPTFPSSSPPTPATESVSLQEQWRSGVDGIWDDAAAAQRRVPFAPLSRGVAGFKSESRLASIRNTWPECVGICCKQVAGSTLKGRSPYQKRPLRRSQVPCSASVCQHCRFGRAATSGAAAGRKTRAATTGGDGNQARAIARWERN
jgi:hypothetical protein